jgi:hypothetical protein
MSVMHGRVALAIVVVGEQRIYLMDVHANSLLGKIPCVFDQATGTTFR